MTQVITESLRTGVTPAAPKSQRVCRHFARGRCTWGTSCRFSHEVERPSVDEASTNPSYIGFHQQRVQKERCAILKEALEGNFEIKQYNFAEGCTRCAVELPPPLAPIPIPRLLSANEVKAQLQELEGNEQLRAGGLLYFVGEPAVFWSMMHYYLKSHTTTSSKWDKLLSNAKRGRVECMFFRSSVGCMSNECTFEHGTTSAVTIPSPLQNMATNNALLAPVLGFGAATATSTVTSANGSTNTPITASNNTGGVGGAVAKSLLVGSTRVPVDLTRRTSVTHLTEKADETVMFSDPVWGLHSLLEPKATTLPTQQQQSQSQLQLQQQPDGLSLLWDDSLRTRSVPLW
ncbi:zinc finger protein family member, putative [Trypanosoma equiperdum]|uniref:C3H1-type domain-containing protein n=4 Tax=Trypanozoon TaxID=39700 RepID=Q38E42_TRYB2|nr:zinc finger protein, predicted [Trypanosoma brucei gambiense DAL972]XP_827258.1 hypothetical protein, conserved [Trypanosoma brucei brucei TREU927]RHW70355.1 zinc finger protein family member [Trypanosoma brucei equiperdum]SCU72485.1 zinc finger protein family member, putative [Trypanosoma equiperdum]EAN76928.1 hypothetical protein, conserved [Trypanosoma brucei brucei TREU927]CBH14468.1 zinc finger protein, predicted [Trypanosoma brucei gambiense DAL972]|eukprot:XP_011776734.1 zinc finger protein, predicted [Trypanosoma brucei gambiense DAL972]